MIPMLYRKNNTSFTTSDIGGLPDATYCVVSEEINGVFELELQYPSCGVNAEHLVVENCITANVEPDKNPEAFRIYRRSSAIDGMITVYARHISYDLNFLQIGAFTASTLGGAVTGLNSSYNPWSIANYPPFYFELNSAAERNGSYENKKITCARNLIEHMRSNVYGGEIEWKMYQCMWHDRRGSDRPDIYVRYGVNMESMNYTIDTSESPYQIVPYWASENTVSLDESEKGKYRIVYGNPIIVSDDDLSSFPFRKTFMYNASELFESEPDVQELTSAVESIVAASPDTYAVKIGIETAVIDLSKTDEYAGLADQDIHIGDTIRIEAPEIGVTSAEIRVTKTEYNVLMDRYERLTLGNLSNSLTDTIDKQISYATSDLTESYSKDDIQDVIDSIESDISDDSDRVAVFG